MDAPGRTPSRYPRSSGRMGKKSAKPPKQSSTSHSQNATIDDFTKFSTEPEDQPSTSQRTPSQSARSGSKSKPEKGKGKTKEKGKQKEGKTGKTPSGQSPPRPALAPPSQHLDSTAPSPVFFDNLQQAEAFREPRAPVRLRTKGEGRPIPDDLDAVFADQHHHIRNLVGAMTRDWEKEAVKPGANRSKEQAHDLWTSWQVEQWLQIQAKIESEDEDVKKMVETRVWALFKEVIAIHQHGPILGCDFDATLKCSDRLDALVRIVADHTSVRSDLVDFERPFLNVHALAASPSAYMRRKIKAFWQRADDERLEAIVQQSANPQSNEAAESDPFDGPHSDDGEDQSGGAKEQHRAERGIESEKRKSKHKKKAINGQLASAERNKSLNQEAVRSTVETNSHTVSTEARSSSEDGGGTDGDDDDNEMRRGRSRAPELQAFGGSQSQSRVRPGKVAVRSRTPGPSGKSGSHHRSRARSQTPFGRDRSVVRKAREEEEKAEVERARRDWEEKVKQQKEDRNHRARSRGPGKRA